MAHFGTNGSNEGATNDLALRCPRCGSTEFETEIHTEYSEENPSGDFDPDDEVDEFGHHRTVSELVCRHCGYMPDAGDLFDLTASTELNRLER